MTKTLNPHPHPRAPLSEQRKRMEIQKNTFCHKSLPEQTFKDESDAATLRQTLPDLTPDDPSEAPALPAEDSTPAAATAEAAEGEEAADAGDHEGEESPGKSPSKKKKKFRTPSFLKKNKK
ncbi:hypothetical protein ILYODFUR_016310 [Ilyodon furcidens]|uniref:Uncharacterized protein n=1 Tax=Ilyodon furcidens TaxID=33524 RepID=A0ABV0TV45_9TELE